MNYGVKSTTIHNNPLINFENIILTPHTAFHSGGIIAIKRIKVHTLFEGEIESGLNKLLTVGLGKKSTSLVHYLGIKGLQDYIVEFALK